MKKFATFVFVLMVILIASTALVAQTAGDYRTRASGNWSMAQNWERFNGATWGASATAPSGSETTTVQSADSIFVDAAVSITDTLVNQGIVVGNNNLTIANGGTYQHDRDGGSIPLSTWAEGSTLLMTGVIAVAPDDRNQDYYNITFNTPGLVSNLNMALDSTTVSGDIRVINTGASARWYLTSTSSLDSSIVTILGDVIVEGGTFATQGTGNGLTTFKVHHYGNIVVTGGSFAISRGSQGGGSGTTTWYLYEGNFSLSNAEARNSNPVPGNAKFVFAKADTQQLTFENVDYAGGDVHFEVSDTTVLDITQNFRANGLFVNRGEILPPDSLIFMEDAVYEHARDGGAVPSSVWEAGSTALFTGITTSAPDNRGQDYYNLTLNTPGLLSNRDLDLDGHTISGDITVVSSGTVRWQLVGGSSGTVTIMGNVIVQDGQFATQGTGSATDVVVDHYGDINVTGGNFSVSRGSQSSGTGTTTWNLHEGNFSMSDAETQNSNPTAGNAKFVFTNTGGSQNLTLSNVTFGGRGLAIAVASGATLDFGMSELGGDGFFALEAGATLATAHANGIAGAVQSTGDVTFDEGASYIFNGTEAQVTSTAMPMTVNNLTIDNAAGVALSQETAINGVLRLVAGVFNNTISFTLGTNGSISYEGGSLLIPTSVEQLPEIPTEFALQQNYPNPFNPTTTIRFDIPQASEVRLNIYNSVGQLVRTLVNDFYATGAYTVTWDARDDAGLRVASGLYYYRISAGDFNSVRKLVLMK